MIEALKLSEDAILPKRATDGSAGCDLTSTESYTLKPLERKLFKTGLAMSIPVGLYGRIAPRSGLAYKNGIDVMAGVIDSDYRKEVGVILINLGTEDFTVNKGDRIAQIIIEQYLNEDFVEVKSLSSTERTGGFGSTGISNNRKTISELYKEKENLHTTPPKPYSEIVKEREK